MKNNQRYYRNRDKRESLRQERLKNGTTIAFRASPPKKRYDTQQVMEIERLMRAGYKPVIHGGETAKRGFIAGKIFPALAIRTAKIVKKLRAMHARGEMPE